MILIIDYTTIHLENLCCKLQGHFKDVASTTLKFKHVLYIYNIT